MRRSLYALVLGSIGLLSSGCALCCAPFDHCYNAAGGKVQRCDACCGRVGSAFYAADGSDAGYEGDVVYEGEPGWNQGPPNSAGCANCARH